MTHNLTTRLSAIRDRIRNAESRFGRPEGSTTLLAVSKTRPADAIRAMAEAGQRLFGESYVQEAVEKLDELQGLGLEWHFIGPIQTNKTRPLAERFDWVHSIDRLKVARRLSEQRPADAPPLNICLQVNVSGEASKSGVPFAELDALAEAIAGLPRLKLRGLMCIPAPAQTLAEQRAPFRRMREALETLNGRGFALDTLSMGMSDDLEAAVAEGATMVRIGTALFGPRG